MTNLEVIKFLTIFEKDYTSTNRQASLAVKSIVAQMINSILIPVIVAYYIKTSTGIYKSGGLVDNIFMMGFTNSLLPPILLFFDPFVIKRAVFKCLKSTSCKNLFIQRVNFLKLKKSIIATLKVYSSKLDLSISIQSTYLCLSASLSLYSQYYPLLHFLAICLCIGSKNTACSIDIEDQFLELTLSIRLSINLSSLDL